MNPTPKEPQMPKRYSLPEPVGGWKPISLRPVRVLVIQHGENRFVGQCLEKNVSAQADSVDKLAEEITHILITQAILDQSAGKPMLEGLQPAAAEYWDAWNDAKTLVVEDVPEVRLAQVQQPARVQLDFRVADLQAA